MAMNNKPSNALVLLAKTINRCTLHRHFKIHSVIVTEVYLSIEWICVRSFIGNNEVACARGKNRRFVVEKGKRKSVALIVTSRARIELDTSKRPSIYYKPMRAALLRSVLSREFRLVNRSTRFDVTSQFGQVWSEKPNPTRPR